MSSRNNANTICLSRFPVEINQRIFATFTQRECVECMRVCRTWRNHVIEWSVDLWRTVQLKHNDMEEMRPVLDLAKDHVRHLVLMQPPEKSVMRIVEKLILRGFAHLHTFALHSKAHCDLVSSTALMNFVKYLKRLHLGSSEVSSSILEILGFCPQLTHFSCCFASNNGANRRKSAIVPHSRIEYLRIGHIVAIDELTQILRHSPRLRLLRIRWHDDMALAKIVETRPELVSLSCSSDMPPLGDDPYWNVDRWPAEGLLTTLSMNDIRRATALQNILAVLNSRWGRLQLERLECRICYDPRQVQQTDSSWTGLVNGPRRLRQLEYTVQRQDPSRRHTPAEELMSMFVIPVLSHCSQLENVRLDLCCDAFEDDETQFPPVHAALCRLPRLRRLRLYETSIDDALLTDMFSQMHKVGIVQLESFELDISAYQWCMESFGQLVKFPTLRHITLDAEGSSSAVVDTAFVNRFVNGIKESKIESLALRSADVVRFTQTFETLCQIPRLKHLTVAGIDSPSGEGLRHIVDNHPSLQAVYLYDTLRSPDIEAIVSYMKTKLDHVVWMERQTSSESPLQNSVQCQS